MENFENEEERADYFALFTYSAKLITQLLVVVVKRTFFYAFLDWAILSISLFILSYQGFFTYS